MSKKREKGNESGPQYTAETPLYTYEIEKEPPQDAADGFDSTLDALGRAIKAHPMEIPAGIKRAVIDAQDRGVSDENIIKAIDDLKTPKMPKGAKL